MKLEFIYVCTCVCAFVRFVFSFYRADTFQFKENKVSIRDNCLFLIISNKRYPKFLTLHAFPTMPQSFINLGRRLLIFNSKYNFYMKKIKAVLNSDNFLRKDLIISEEGDKDNFVFNHWKQNAKFQIFLKRDVSFTRGKCSPSPAVAWIC